MKTKYIFACILVIVLFYYIYNYYSYKYVCSTTSNTCYYVVPNTTEKMQENANTLAEINSRIERLISFMSTDRSVQEDIYKKELYKTLVDKYSFKTLSESLIQPNFTSYTVNKKDIYMCLRTRDKSEQTYDYNTLLYVVLHEISHLIAKNIGHDTEFLIIFKFIVQEAIKAGVYTYEDYSVKPINYCGLTLRSNIIG